MRVILIAFALLSNSLIAQDCNGAVNNFEIYEDWFFTGICNNQGQREIGETLYKTGDENHGDRQVGTYENGVFKVGVYYWSNGAIKLYRNVEETYRNSLPYDNIGTYIWDDDDQAWGYWLSNNLNGFGQIEYQSGDIKREVGVITLSDGGYRLNGYGLRVMAEDDGHWYGFWKDGGAIGDVYYQLGDKVDKYSRISGNTTGPFKLNSADWDRYNLIFEFIDKERDQFNKEHAKTVEINENHDQTLNFRLAELGSNQANPDPNRSSSIETIASIQELLNELNYSTGTPDGILGPRTQAAITAFKFENDIDAENLSNADLLILLQLAIRSEVNQSIESASEVKIGSKLVGSGSGFYISRNAIVTNFHVIAECNYLEDSNSNRLEILAEDRVNDLALLSGPTTRNYLNLSLDKIEVGDQVYTAGFPYNDVIDGFNFTDGSVSSLFGLNRNTSEFQITAPIQPGNSGGPIINENGSVIGVVVYRLDDSTIADQTGTLPQNMNYGIKGYILKNFADLYNIEYVAKKKSATMSARSIARNAESSSVLVKCYE